MLKLFKRLISIILSRTFILLFLFLLQFALFTFLIFTIGNQGVIIYFIFLGLSVFEGICIMNRRLNPAYKISWLIAIFALPFFGFFFYLIFGRIKITKKISKKFNQEKEEDINFYKKYNHNLDLKDKDFIKVSNYISYTTNMPVCDKTKTDFLSPGEVAYPVILEELKKAQKFIFLEFFIIKYGVMWDSIYSILKEKVKAGVDVRIIYDDFGCLNKLKNRFPKDLRANGIKVAIFNPLIPVFSARFNYRDHRKLIVIDNKVGFTGGMNISDEYINKIEKFGHWNDCFIKIDGLATNNMTYLFLKMWEQCTKESLKPDLYLQNYENNESDGYIQVFGDGPYTQENSTEAIYMEIINEANKYVYITTPYLILSNEIITALKTIALSGIDVKIITPMIPDKKTVNLVTKSNYLELLEANVKIYEYTPGFIHGKTIISDDSLGIVGSANFDFRSLYLNYEISCMLYDSTTIKDIKNKFLKTIEKSKEIKIEDVKKISIMKKIIAAILKAFSPML